MEKKQIYKRQVKDIGRQEKRKLQIEYKKKAVKYINCCDKDTKKRLKKAIEALPFGDIKILSGLQNEYRLRVGDLRVLFTKENNIITINDILPRGQAYNNL